jgi:beta-glucanase (GH16 family)
MIVAGRRPAARRLAALPLIAGLVAAVGSPGATAVVQSATIAVLPPISQYGATPASPSSASTVISVRVSPITAGRPVVLSSRSGSAWRRVAETTLTAAGLAEFSVPSLVQGRPVTYRATASRYQGQAPVTTGPVVSSQWGSPDFVEEFSGSSLSGSWSHRGGAYNPAGLRNCSKGSPEAVRVAEGTVRLSVLRDESRSDTCTAYRANGTEIGQFNYRLNGHISTQGSADLTYGVAAARVKFQQSRGQHGAFWLQPTAPVPGASSATEGGAEIDVIEWFGTGGANGGLTSSVYYPTGNGTAKSGGWIVDPSRYLAGTSDAWWASYHVFSVEWTPQAYVFRIDGRETWRSSEGVSGRPQYLILSLLSSDYELPNLGGEDLLPQHMYVDWVQYWEN